MNLFIKSWRGSRKTLVKVEGARLQSGYFKLALTSLNKNTSSVFAHEITDHNFDVDWEKINKLSFGGGSNGAFGGFKMYDRLLTDQELGQLRDTNNNGFNKSGPTYP